MVTNLGACQLEKHNNGPVHMLRSRRRYSVLLLLKCLIHVLLHKTRIDSKLAELKSRNSGLFCREKKLHKPKHQLNVQLIYEVISVVDMCLGMYLHETSKKNSSGEELNYRLIWGNCKFLNVK